MNPIIPSLARIFNGTECIAISKSKFTDPAPNIGLFVKVFIANGELVFDPETGEGRMQYLQRRPIIFEMNRLHKASIGTLWKWVSDVMAIILLFVAISGLFLLKGKRGLKRWGWWFTIAGIVVPLIFALLFI